MLGFTIVSAHVWQMTCPQMASLPRSPPAGCFEDSRTERVELEISFEQEGHTGGGVDDVLTEFGVIG